MIGEAIVLDLTFKGKANERITPADLERAERALAEQGSHLTKGATIFLRTDWPKGHVTTDPKWWDESPCLTREAAEWLVSKQPKVLGYDFAQEEKGAGIGYQKADERSSRARCRGQLDLGIPIGTDSPASLRSEHPTHQAPLARPVLLRLEYNALG
jgi:kynurenine formamidase